MSNTSDFADCWNAYAERMGRPEQFPLARFAFESPSVSDRTKRFLNEVGLPSGAGLDWEKPEIAGRRLLEEYALDVDWSAAGRARLEPFLILGFNQGGDPVVLDMAHDEQVVLLDHEDNFEIRQLINSGVAQLAECILVFQEMVETYQNTFGDEADLYENNVPPEMVGQAKLKIDQIDAKALADNGYWVEIFDYI